MQLEHAVVHKTPHVYSSHPCVARLQGGDWLVIFNESVERKPFLHPPADPHYVNVLIRSSDRGSMWSEPQQVPDFGWYGVENPGIVQLANGDVLLNQWKFDWTPRDLARKRWTLGDGEFFLCPDRGEARHVWSAATTKRDWEAHAFPYARSDRGAFIQISKDEGRTWEHTVPVNISPYRGAFSPQGAVEVSNGDVLLALGSHDHDPLHASFIVRSTDHGRTWKDPVEVARREGREFCEPSLTESASGRLVVMSREEANGFLWQSDSLDGGYTWSPPRRLDIWGYPAHVVTLSDDRLLMVYGRRRPPFGIRAALSEDDGHTWGPEITLRELPNLNHGYPSVIEYEPGQLFTAYYAEDADGTTCIQGTHVKLD